MTTLPRRWRWPAAHPLLVPVFCIGLVASMWAAIGYQSAYEREAAIADRQQEQDSFARLFEEHVLNVLATASVVLRNIESEFRRQGARLDLAQFLRDRPELRYYHNVAVVDAAGYVVLNSAPFTRPLSVRDSESFHFHRDRAASDLFLAKPTLGKATGRWTMHLTRRMNRPDGSFDGNTTIGIDPEYFSRFYDQIALGGDSVAMLVGRDGIVRARRSNKSTEVGQDMSRSILFTTDLPAREAGQKMWASAIDGVTRLYSYRSVKGYPLVVTVGSSRDVVLEPVEQRARAYRWWASGLSIVISGFAALFTLHALRRRRFERTLHRRDVVLQQAQAIAHLGSWTWHIREDRLEWSAEMHRIFGIPTEGFSGGLAEVITRAIHPDDRAVVERRAQAAIRGEMPEPVEYRVIRPDGSVRVVWSEAGKPDFDEHGRAAVLTGVAQDITERKRAEAELRTLSRAVEQSPTSIVITDRAGNIEYVNPRFEEVTGYAKAEAIGKNPRILKSELTPAQTYVELWKAIAGGGEWRGTLCNRKKNGDLIWEYAAISGLKDDRGQVAHYIAVKEDITERRNADAALRESEARYAAVFRVSPIGIAITRVADSRILEVNHAVSRMYGYSRDEMIGRTVEEMRFHVSEARRAEMMDQLRAHGRIEGFEFEFRRRTGEIGTVAMSGVPIEIAGEQCLVAMTEDITERKRLEEMHLQSQKLESLGTLAGGIAHDFNNILAAIRGNADLAAEDVGPEHIAAESLQEIRKATARASELVRRILAFARPGEAKQRRVDLGAVVDEVLKLLRSTLPASISLKTEFAKDAPAVLADSGQIHEAVVNLATNAAHAIGPRAGWIECRVEPVQVEEKLVRSIPGLKVGRYARLTVTDSGCGMDAATLERIFDAFYTTKAAGEGTGLGLSMVHGTMKGHGGAVTVESVPGKGSSFALYFPAAKDERERQEETTAPASEPLDCGKRVLYVDDEEALVFLASRVLSRLGHSITGYTDPKEALAEFRAHPQDYDIVVTDLSMPHMSGYDIAREVLAVRPGMPVLMTTGYVRPEDEHKAREAGIRGLVLKPITVEELGRVLDRLLREAAGADGGSKTR